jgi:PPM family protein phosphatase
MFVVADGMGGHEAGEVASQIAVEEVRRLAGRTWVTAEDVHLVVQGTAARLRGVIPAGRTAGTTFAGVGLAQHDRGEYWLVFNVGDSRVYRLAGKNLQQITIDHSVVQELVEAGIVRPEEARSHPDRHVITRAIGTGADPEPDYWMVRAESGDRILVCTDGLTEELTDEQIAAVLGAHADPQRAAERLVDAAVGSGGRDNVTVVVVDLVRPEEGPLRRPVAAARPWDEQHDGSTNPRASRNRVPEVDRR